MTDLIKKQIAEAIEREAEKLGSLTKVAQMLGTSSATLSANVRNERNWPKVADGTWATWAGRLNVRLTAANWNVVATTNLRIMQRTLHDAQAEALFMAVSERAGSGKTTAITAYVEADTHNSVFSLQCEEWPRKQFLVKLAQRLGVKSSKYDTVDSLTESVVRFFKQRAKDGVTPLLILDEADKLRPAALRFLIVLYNRLEDEIGLVAAGTENLEKEVKAGVRKAQKGYDEIDSRLGRSFVHLVGATREDVRLICEANGVTDAAAQERVWSESGPERRLLGRKYVEVVSDMRSVKRKIKRERLLVSGNSITSIDQ